MPPTRRARNASTPADPGPIPADLELGRLYVKDLRSLCSRLNPKTTGGCDALIKRIEEARTNTDNLPGTPPPIQDGGEANFPFVNGRCHLKRSMPFLRTVVAI